MLDTASSVRMIPIDDIIIPADRPEAAPENVAGLVSSIRALGHLIHPITVITLGSRYQLIAGLNRLEAFREMGEASIPADVREYATPAHEEMAEITENLHRKVLIGSIRDRAYKRWGELYEVLCPPRPPLVAATKGAAHERFDEHAARITGMSPETVRQAVRRAEVFDDDDFAVMDERGLTQKDMRPIVALADPGQRKAAIAEIAKGQTVDDAIATVHGPPPELCEPDPEGFDDTGWLATLPAREMVADKALFDRDALCYRDLMESLIAFRTACKSPLKEARGRPTPPFVYILERLVKVDHPRAWKVCGECDGSGFVAGTRCKECRGAGYVTC